jgi:hypothetical protein
MASGRHGGMQRRSRGHAGPSFASVLQRVFNAATGRRRSRSTHHRSHHGRDRASQAASGPWLLWQEVSVRRLVIAGGLACLVGWFGWSIVADSIAARLADTAPDTALWLSEQETTALDQLAQQALTRDVDLDAAANFARRALHANPLDVRALFYLGFVAEQKGDKARADKLAQLAGARSWRDLPTQLWLFQRAIRRRDFATALAHFDALYRVNFLNGAMIGRLFPVLADFTLDPKAFAAMRDALATAPEWRPWYLHNLSLRLANIDRLGQLYESLDKSAKPPTRDEIRPFLKRLIDAGRYQEAHDRWRHLLLAPQRAKLPLLYDGDFERPPHRLFFDWSLTTVLGADPRIVPLAGNTDHALRIQFSGARVGAPSLASQLLMLPAGSYRLSGSVKADDLETARGLRWRIVCAEGKPTLAQTELVKGTLPWTGFAAAFTVPAAGCKAQWLQLQLFARIPPETAIEGQVWYRALRIDRIEGAPRAEAGSGATDGAAAMTSAKGRAQSTKPVENNR